MKIKKIFVILLLATCPFMTFAQKAANETPVKTIELTISKNTLFDGIIDYLQDNSFFLMSMDKQSGFIQAKIYIKNPKKLSAKVGERRTLNFIIRPIKENQSKLSVSNRSTPSINIRYAFLSLRSKRILWYIGH